MFLFTSMSRARAVFFSALATSVLFATPPVVSAQPVPFTIQGPGVHPAQFRITRFASGLTLPVAVAGTVSFILSGVLGEVTVSWATGYVSWPAVVTVATGTVLLAPLGTKVSHHVPPRAMRIGFGIFLMLLGIRMITV